MLIRLRNSGGGKITVDGEGAQALLDLISDVLTNGHGYQSDGTLPEIILVDDDGKPILPKRTQAEADQPDEQSSDE